MDSTILCEKAPIYVDSCLTMYRVLDDPTYAATEEEARVHAGNAGPRLCHRRTL